MFKAVQYTVQVHLGQHRLLLKGYMYRCSSGCSTGWCKTDMSKGSIGCCRTDMSRAACKTSLNRTDCCVKDMAGQDPVGQTVPRANY